MKTYIYKPITLKEMYEKIGASLDDVPKFYHYNSRMDQLNLIVDTNPFKNPYLIKDSYGQNFTLNDQSYVYVREEQGDDSGNSGKFEDKYIIETTVRDKT